MLGYAPLGVADEARIGILAHVFVEPGVAAADAPGGGDVALQFHFQPACAHFAELAFIVGDRVVDGDVFLVDIEPSGAQQHFIVGLVFDTGFVLGGGGGLERFALCIGAGFGQERSAVADIGVDAVFKAVERTGAPAETAVGLLEAAFA